jgi:hypothetical protein
MPESGASNVESAHILSDQRVVAHPVAHEALEFIAGIVLAIVAIATAWSGYQATLWTGHQAEEYGVASKLRIQAGGIATIANQERLYNVSTVVEWLKAEANGQIKLAGIFEQRIVPEFRPAFEAWKKTDPLHNPGAPPGPFFMGEYHSAKTDEARRFDQQAEEAFDLGNRARKNADDYVQVTVTLATVLLMVALSQRFKTHSIRIALAVTAALLLCLPIYRIFVLPRA